MENPDWLVVGAGFTGATIARCLAQRGRKVLVLDKRDHVGGNAYDAVIDRMYRHVYGPHLFHTNSDNVWEFVNLFGEWRSYHHRVVAQIEGQQYVMPLPFNYEGIERVFGLKRGDEIKKELERIAQGPHITLGRIAQEESLKDLYKWVSKHVFEGYSKKMWGMGLESLDEDIVDRVPIRIGFDNRYFLDKYQGLPVKGYEALFKSMLDHENIEVQLNTTCSLKPPFKQDIKTVFTGPIDEFYGFEYGELPYRSLRFDFSWGVIAWNQPATTLNDTSENTPWTRKTFNGVLAPDHLQANRPFAVTTEFPEAFVKDKNERFYPIPGKANRELYNKYADLKTENVWFAGRMGSFQYLNMDQAIAQALKLFGQIKDL